MGPRPARLCIVAAPSVRYVWIPDDDMTRLQYSELEGELGRIAARDFTSQFRGGYVRAEPCGAVLPKYYTEFGDRILDMTVHTDDHWIVSFPKSGTTWTQEMVWCIQNDLDFEKAKIPLPERFPFLEHSPLFDYRDILPRIPDLKLPLYVTNSVKYIDEMPSPRFIKTHIPWELLPRQIQDGSVKPKVIYVARNAKDTCVSYYHHCKLLEGYKGSFDDFCKLFLGNSVCFSPFWSHILSFWDRRNEPNILFLKYEDMKKDLPSVIRKTAKFLGKELNDSQIDVLTNHLSFQNMKNNPSVNYEAVVEINRTYNLIAADGEFMRSGTVGEWKAKMSPELIDKFDKWKEENLKDTGLTL
ncbi:luciferin sulfotransferase-like isoform X1 [Schistocerca serialis cubense]|uniref:luciferin sulfotransferase-like isoform X1 n=1 Tax=Schistocerca serialis cubense TaxID=2023355 RepID=UPI00214E9AB0|nr:luciferin sulfotransferase-like isoform X1 [Schistocerca serialis cubense]